MESSDIETDDILVASCCVLLDEDEQPPKSKRQTWVKNIFKKRPHFGQFHITRFIKRWEVGTEKTFLGEIFHIHIIEFLKAKPQANQNPKVYTWGDGARRRREEDNSISAFKG